MIMTKENAEYLWNDDEKKNDVLKHKTKITKMREKKNGRKIKTQR